MKIATWNINGIKARLPNVIEWLKEAQPDIACLQEIKSVDENFPGAAIEDLGYNVATHGQKSFNGVAVLSKLPFDEVRRGLPGDPDDPQARYIETVCSTDFGALRVASIYLPNGNPVDSEKFPYKLAWMERLRLHAAKLLENEEPLVLAGDYNVIPEPEDCHDPQAWQGDALFRADTRGALRQLIHLGLLDSFRACDRTRESYTFWDFQAGAWNKNNGIRIDHLLLSPQAADRLTTCRIDKHTRGWERPSDHVPIWVELR
jgi:exodeoxyribonuclease-3